MIIPFELLGFCNYSLLNGFKYLILLSFENHFSILPIYSNRKLKSIDYWTNVLWCTFSPLLMCIFTKVNYIHIFCLLDPLYHREFIVGIKLWHICFTLSPSIFQSPSPSHPPTPPSLSLSYPHLSLSSFPPFSFLPFKTIQPMRRVWERER